jgi:putative oxygen-independent coproporphyrinogen III oxidase
MSLGLYLHIPYCFSKCRYCDFYSAPGQRGVPTQYVDALLRELARFAPEAPLHPDTIYFGGGTPSLLSPADAARLIAAAAPAPGAEITLEANPETVTEQTLCGFREAGVNRISFGVQSARDSQLKTLGRPHTARQARAAFAAAQRAGFTNISGDIMLALPHYTQAEFDETLELIAEGGATHISAYLLKIEPDSAFGRHPPEGLPSPDEAADFYLYAVEHLEHHGYRQYEISNFAKPGYEGRHNLIYWDCGDYLGLGPAAHSCMGGRRFYYPADTEAFLNDKAAPVMDGGCGAEDYLILQLRLRKGLDLAAYKARYGKEFSTAQLAFVKNCVKSGYATFDGSTLALTPAGLIVQNSILAELL